MVQMSYAHRSNACCGGMPISAKPFMVQMSYAHRSNACCGGMPISAKPFMVQMSYAHRSNACCGGMPISAKPFMVQMSYAHRSNACCGGMPISAKPFMVQMSYAHRSNACCGGMPISAKLFTVLMSYASVQCLLWWHASLGKTLHGPDVIRASVPCLLWWHANLGKPFTVQLSYAHWSSGPSVSISLTFLQCDYASGTKQVHIHHSSFTAVGSILSSKAHKCDSKSCSPICAHFAYNLAFRAVITIYLRSSHMNCVQCAPKILPYTVPRNIWTVFSPLTSSPSDLILLRITHSVLSAELRVCSSEFGTENRIFLSLFLRNLSGANPTIGFPIEHIKRQSEFEALFSPFSSESSAVATEGGRYGTEVSESKVQNTATHNNEEIR
ncbi:hypothetical protein C8F04DRAFT_1335766 [Mycena alexandri]|uniref:Uncharacterized protein n=1 Tax=Mycena alexandri TaxID=1745969 RepID=A0AAD6RYZ2_9AGAR|nr:hypothetical protein C8F04DRAFT_1335766 [Mycena alexandri]